MKNLVKVIYISVIQPDINNDTGIPFHCATTRQHFLFRNTIILARKKEWVQIEHY